MDYICIHITIQKMRFKKNENEERHTWIIRIVEALG